MDFGTNYYLSSVLEQAWSVEACIQASLTEVNTKKVVKGKAERTDYPCFKWKPLINHVTTVALFGQAKVRALPMTFHFLFYHFHFLSKPSYTSIMSHNLNITRTLNLNITRTLCICIPTRLSTMYRPLPLNDVIKLFTCKRSTAPSYPVKCWPAIRNQKEWVQVLTEILIAALRGGARACLFLRSILQCQ